MSGESLNPFRDVPDKIQSLDDLRLYLNATGIPNPQFSTLLDGQSVDAVRSVFKNTNIRVDFRHFFVADNEKIYVIEKNVYGVYITCVSDLYYGDEKKCFEWIQGEYGFRQYDGISKKVRAKVFPERNDNKQKRLPLHTHILNRIGDLIDY